MLPGEESSVALMTAHAFFMGTATVFFETAASAFFLARFEAKAIPWVYVAAAVVNLATGTLYARAQRRVSFGRLMQGTLWFLLVGVLLARAGFAASSASWIVFGGLVGYRILSSLTDLEYWAVAGRIYDIRQAKRLFGLIGTGEVVARMAGAFAVPLIVRLTGVSNLLLLSAAGLGSCLVLVRAVLGRAHDGEATTEATATEVATEATAATEAKAPAASEPDVRLGLRAIAASPYLTLVVGVAIAATFGKYFVDFAFLEQMSMRSRVDVELASYLGVFAGLTQTLSLLARLLVSRPLLARFGVRVGVMVLPVLQLACTVGLVVSGALGGPVALVFWLVLGNQGLYKTLKHPVDNASFKVLYQPLPPAQRLGAQIAVEVVLAPVVVGVAGAVMLLFSAVIPYDPVRFGLVLLVTFALWSWLAWRAGRTYLHTLLDRLRPEATVAGEQAGAVAGEASGEVSAELLAGLAALAPGARGAQLAALDRAAYVADAPAREVLRRLLRDEAREAARTLGAWRDLGASADTAGLRAALVAEVGHARERVFAAVACGHDRAAVQRARDNLAHATRDRRAYAHEVLDLTLAPSERAYLLPMLEDLPPADRLARLARVFAEPARDPSERLRQLLERPARAASAATRALALEAARGRRLAASCGTSGRSPERPDDAGLAAPAGQVDAVAHETIP